MIIIPEYVDEEKKASSCEVNCFAMLARELCASATKPYCGAESN